MRFLTTCFTYPGGSFSVALVVNTAAFVLAPFGCPYPVSKRMILDVNATSDGFIPNASYSLFYELVPSPYLEGWFSGAINYSTPFVATGNIPTMPLAGGGSTQSPVYCAYYMPGEYFDYCHDTGGGPGGGVWPCYYSGEVAVYEPIGPFSVQLSFLNNSAVGCGGTNPVITQYASMHEDLSL